MRAVKPGRRVYLTPDRARHVFEDDPDARFLAFRADDELPHPVARELGLLADGPKMRRIHEDKAVKAPTGDKAGMPPDRAPKAAWVDWAVSQGFDRDDAEAMTKQDLVDLSKG